MIPISYGLRIVHYCHQQNQNCNDLSCCSMGHAMFRGFQLGFSCHILEMITLMTFAGFVPSTDLMRSASGMQKFFSRYIMHGMLRFAKMTRSVPQGGQAIITVATDEKYKGKGIIISKKFDRNAFIPSAACRANVLTKFHY